MLQLNTIWNINLLVSIEIEHNDIVDTKYEKICVLNMLKVTFIGDCKIGHGVHVTSAP